MTSFECGAGGSTSSRELSVRVPREALPLEGRFGIAFELPDDAAPDVDLGLGRVGQRAGVTRAEFWVAREGDDPSRGPRIIPFLPRRSAPGWDRPVRAEDVDAYLGDDAAPLAASAPLAPHEALRLFGAELPFGLPGLPLPRETFVHVHGEARLVDLGEGDDFGDGVRFVPGAPGTNPDAAVVPFAEAHSATRRGLVPGRLYDLRLYGQGRLGARSVTQAPSGAVVVPWTDGPVPPCRPSDDPFGPPPACLDRADVRFVFRTSPVRVERVGDGPEDAPVGAGAVDRSLGDARLPVELIVPDEDGLPPYRTFRVDLTWRTSLGFVSTGLVGRLPFVTLDPDTGAPTGVASVGRETLAQAGVRLPVIRVRLLVPLPSADVLRGASTVRVDAALLGPNTTPATDFVERPVDFVPPAAPPAACSADVPVTSSLACTAIADTDERDCRIDGLCLPVDADAAEVEVTLCGARVRAPLRDVTRDGTSWRCAATPLEAPAPPGGGPGPRRGPTVDVVVVDRAGNASAVTTLSPPCFPVPERWVGPASDVGAHARDVAGFPVAMHAQGPSLMVERWTGAWERAFVRTTPGRVYRGRGDTATLADGSLAFCASYAPGGSYADALAGPGGVDLVHVRRDGTIDVIERTVARGLGCSLATTADGRTLYLGLAAGGAAPGPGVPEVRQYTVAAGGLRPSASLTVADPPGARALPLDLAVAVSPSGEVAVAGRGLLSPDGRIEEGSLWLAAQVPGGTRALVARRLAAQAPMPSLQGGMPVTCSGGQPRALDWFAAPRAVWVGAAPQVLALRTRATVTQVAFGDVPSCGRSAARSDLVAIAPASGRVSVVASVAESLGLPRPAFALGRYDLEAAVEPEVPPPFDVREEARGTGLLQVLYAQRPYGTERADLFPAGGVALAVAQRTPSALVLARAFIAPGRATVLGRTRVDVEVGGRDASRVASLALDRVARPFVRTPDGRVVDGPPALEPSVLFDRRVANVSTLSYAEERAGHFLGQGGTPLAAAGTCWEETFGPGRIAGVAGLDADGAVSRAALSAAEIGLQPDPPSRLGDWSSVRLTPLASRDTQNSSEGLVCATRAIGDDALRLREGPAYQPIDLPVYRDLTRADVFGNLLGVIFSGDASTARATLAGRRRSLELARGGTLVVRAGADTRTVTVPEGEPSTFVARLDAALVAAFGGDRVRAHAFVVEDAQGRELGVDDSRLVLSAASRAAGGPPPTVAVLGGTLATELGFPVGRPGWRAGIDAAHGDAQDRFRPCNEPCVPGEGGNCDKPADCLRSDRPLLGDVFEGLTLSLGAPPRRRQSNVCVPAAFATAPPGTTDACELPHRAGTAGSYPAFAVPPVGGFCPAGAFIAPREDGRVACVTCGLPVPRDSSLPQVEGRVRTCRTDADCAGNRPACRGRDCPFDPAQHELCNRLTVPFMGQPPGTGVCTRPSQRCPADRRIARRFEGFTFLAGPAPPLPIISVCPSPNAVDPARDFEPAPVTADGRGPAECTLSGCLACTGASSALGDGTNDYCFADADCPPGHVCLDPTGRGATLRTPACLLRPLLGDGRLREIARDLTRPETFNSGDSRYNLRYLRDDVLPLFRAADRRIADALGALRLPERFVLPVTSVGSANAQLSVLGVRGTLGRAALTLRPDADTDRFVVGGGWLELTVPVRGVGVALHAEVSGDPVRYSGPLRATVEPSEVRFHVVLVPLVRGGRGAGGGQLTFAVARARFEKRGSSARPWVPLDDGDIAVDIRGDPLATWLIAAVRSFVDAFRDEAELPDVAGLVGILGDVVGEVLTALLDDTPVLALFAGADSSALALGPLQPELTGLAVSRPASLETAAVTAGGGGWLDLRYRGRRTATGDLAGALRFAPALCTP